MSAPALRAIVAAAALPLLARATPYDYSAPGAFTDGLCDLAFTDTEGASYEFDLRPVATTNGSVAGFGLTPCGVVNLACETMPVPWPYGAGVQFSGAPWQCYFALSTGPPLHELTNPSNAATGGLTTTFGPAWTQLSNPDTCHDWSPVKGREEGRKIVLVHQCDPTAAPGTVKYIGVIESPVCTYTATLSSLAACGIKVAAAPAVVAPIPNPPAPAVPAWAPSAGPFAPYLCTPVLRDTGGNQWHFELQQLFSRGADYSVTTALGKFSLSMCGLTATTCTPAYAVAANFGGLVVQWAGGAPPPAGTLCSWANGSAAPCTAPCRTLGEGAPFFSLANASDGATGGLIMALQSELVLADEPASTPRCGYDAQGDPLFPSVSAHIACDFAVATLVVDDVQSSTNDAVCVFLVKARSRAACGTPN